MEEKKESWIETLIELLNEYDEIREYAEVDLEDELISLKIISKWYWFIQRLVDNDKIDIKKMYEKVWKPQIVVYERYSEEEELCEWVYVNERSYCEDVLMLLSISDTPIDDLISYLK